MTEKKLHGIFCSNIKLYRKNVNMTQSVLARKAGISINFMNDVEAGKKWPSFATLVKLAAVLEIEVYELLKPPGCFPDNLDGIVKKYTDNIHTALEKNRIEFMQAALEQG
ncbi:MAG: helix-turn-helix domain-containing protein [Treponema sp.]|jgi:transcriptional regulator with XRE-family HTH domain|nr:helix-turn-helix domain-containing protein [Treponema sp.]